MFKKIIRNIDYIKLVLRKKDKISRLFNSKNYIFTKYSHPGHFYSPIPDLKYVINNQKTLFNNATNTLDDLNINEESQVELLNLFHNYYDNIPFLKDESKSYRYYFDNSYFSYGDGVILYSMLLHFKPKRIIEIGSGFSSAEMLDIDDIFFQDKIDFTFIEPNPERLLKLISTEDIDNVNIFAKPVQEINLNEFSLLDENDILFIDSSHISKIGSDVNFVLFNILPLLKKGVLIHFHDIIWPFEYPKKWVARGRAYNESYLLRAFLQNNDKYKILFFNSFMVHKYLELIKKKLPLMAYSSSYEMTIANSSLWLRKS
tara:strand:+ start:427 stop:1374 length:948 start_codon:yes stop_codon:yes gene_type:complete